VKVSISLSEDDVAFVDEYVRASGLESRSAAIRRALHLLRLPELEQDYETAWTEWAASGDEAAWDATAGDGLTDEAR